MIGTEYQYLQNCQAATFFKHRGGLMKFLSEAYPEHPWEQDKFSNRQKKILSMVFI